MRCGNHSHSSPLNVISQPGIAHVMRRANPPFIQENTMQSFRISSTLKSGVIAFALSAGTLAASAASANCNDVAYGWTDTVPSVNVRHIFCGEIRYNRPKGYHSKVYSPATDVVTGTQNATVPVNGIYNARVNFNNGTNKFSTFFPNACSQDQIVHSVIYAATHTTGPAVPWGELGPSAPNAGGAEYCLGADGRPFTIRYALDEDDDVNTAFPN